MNITEFLLARIAEDQWEAKSWDGHDGGWPAGRVTRTLAECKSKRAIVEAAREALAEHQIGTAKWLRVLNALALPYADHPDYRRVRPDITKLNDLTARAVTRAASDN